jgi:hypothetical protein
MGFSFFCRLLDSEPQNQNKKNYAKAWTRIRIKCLLMYNRSMKREIASIHAIYLILFFLSLA